MIPASVATKIQGCRENEDCPPKERHEGSDEFKAECRENDKGKDHVHSTSRVDSTASRDVTMDCMRPYGEALRPRNVLLS